MTSLKNRKKKIVYASFIVLIAIMIFSIVSLFNSKERNISNIHDPEILRSINYEEVKEGEDAVAGTDFVKFDAFFTRDLTGSGYANKLRGSCRSVTENDTLFISINVLTEGHFEDGEITINGQNMKLQTAIVADYAVLANVISQDTKIINLKTLYPGTQKLISGIVKQNIREQYK